MYYRDIKPENILLRKNGTLDSAASNFHLRLIDFGSAVDSYTFFHMYGSFGPSENEQTEEYSPPEARFARLILLILPQLICAWVSDCVRSTKFDVAVLEGC